VLDPFEKSEINEIKLPNRFMRSATWEGMASEDGSSTRGLVDILSELARGQVGLIISSHAYVRRDGQAGPWQLGVYEDRLIEGLREMAKEIHEEGGRIVLQITHAGLFANTALTGQVALAPSEHEEYSKRSLRALFLEEIEEIEKGFVDAADRA
jgi:2,4-dienoyl-CoA reductase-like NADH-dependent reductase (Old Yellow Enzyme family)